MALALLLIFSSVTDGGRCMLSKTDLGVTERDDVCSLFGVLGVSGNGRFIKFSPFLSELTRSCQEVLFNEGVGEGGIGSVFVLT